LRKKEADTRNVVEEFAQRLHGITPEVIELVDEDLRGLVGDGSGCDRQRLVCEEITIVGGGELGSEVCGVIQSVSVSAELNEQIIYRPSNVSHCVRLA